MTSDLPLKTYSIDTFTDASNRTKYAVKLIDGDTVYEYHIVDSYVAANEMALKWSPWFPSFDKNGKLKTVKIQDSEFEQLDLMGD